MGSTGELKCQGVAVLELGGRRGLRKVVPDRALQETVLAEFETTALLKAVEAEGTSAAVQGLTTVTMSTVAASAAVLFI